MAKKKGGKRKDDYWDEEFQADVPAENPPAETEEEFAQRAQDFSSLAKSENVEEVEEEDGLMAMVNKAAKNKVKKGKKGKQPVVEEEEVEPVAQTLQEAITEPAEEIDDFDWVNDNKKGKKNKKSKAPKVENEEPVETAEIPAEAPAAEGEIRILSKKEKEKLKKEKLKEAKRLAALEKKQQQEAEEAEFNKSLGLEESENSPTTGTDAPVKSKKQLLKEKKMKKLAKQEEEVPAEVAAPPPVVEEVGKGKKKGKGGQVAALRKLLEAQRAAEEEAKKKEMEERKRIEEEEKRLAEEEARKEAARQLKKEKERLKKEQLRKEGKFLTKAQKEAQRLAKIRHEQLLASGNIRVQALEESDAKPKKVVYTNRKKKGPTKEEQEKKQQELAEKKRLEEEEKKRLEEEKKAAESESEDDDWEKALESSEDEKEDEKSEEAEDVKSDWDASSDEEKETPAPNDTKAATKPVPENPKKATAPVKAAPTKAAPVKATPAKAIPAKATPAKESDSEEESDEDDSDDDDDSEEDDSDYSDSDDESEEEELTPTQRAALKKKEEATARRIQRQQEAMANRSKDDLRSPICCILGHVDTGKTKLLDKIRQTNVQEGEAGGITQQIGATYFPADAISKKTAVLGPDRAVSLKVPGLLVIDTPGHESFTNLRTRGSSLCNIAILVVDIMHGIEPQTLESIRLLRDRKTPFIVALNKIDRLFEWKAIPDNSFLDSLAKQKPSVQAEFQSRVEKTIVAFAEQGLNAQLYYKNKNFAKYVSLVPTSAHTGEGIPDMLNLLIDLTQSRMSDKLMYITELECTVLEVKVIEGLGTTIDVVLVNGWLHEGDRIVVCGLNGPIVTTVRALLTPQPMRELRIKSQYVHHKSVKAALGIKISAPDLEKAIAGSRLLVVGPDDDVEDLKEEVMSDLTNLMTSIDRTGHGVWVQASTLGALEALLEFLRTSKIPVSGINIGPVHRKDVVKASVMLDKAREFAVMLCFDVKIDKDAEELAEELGIRVFTADIIYHLFDRFQEYHAAITEQKRKDQAPSAVFPCVLKMVPRAIFNKKDPIIIGVDVIEGTLRLGTPLCVVKSNPETGAREIVSLGKVTSIEQNHKTLELVKKGGAGGGVAIKIECAVYETPKTYGRHFEETDEIYPKITRQSIDVMKESFRNDLSKEEWALIVKLKKILGVD